MPATLPEVTHIYQHHTLDSTVWGRFIPRADDIVIASAYKSGTTWTQAIVAHLILDTQSLPDLTAVSPWIDSQRNASGNVIEQLEAQRHRRFIKSHVALDGLPFHPQIKYIVLGRDGRDVFMSLWNHHSSYSEDFLQRIDAAPGRVGPPMPRAPQDIHEFWRDWISKGSFEWETEGYPYWGNLHHTKTWWPYRTLDNVLFVHFNDLLADLSGEIRRIAQFLNIACSEEKLAEVAHAVTFSTMKRNAEALLPGAENVWKGGSRTFIFKGTNGRWRDVLTPEELAMYAAAVARVLPPACAAWLERGRAALL